MTDSFASFVADPATHAALSAVRLLAEGPRMPYLLVLVGQRGAGKTHLLRAVRDRLTTATPPRSVELVALGRLTDLVHNRGLTDAGAALRDRLRRADVVLFDDLDAAERQIPVQAFLYDVIESRMGAGLATVAATGKAVSAMPNLDTRLGRRLRDGTTVELGRPGPDTIAAILSRKIADVGGAVHPALAVTLAGVELRSVKEYLGALQRILAVQQATPTPITPDDALSLLGLGPQDPPPAPLKEAGALESPRTQSGAEFDAFLTEVVANVSQQFDRWRGRIREAIAHWQAQGVRTRRLEQALLSDTGGDPEPLVATFGHDASELQRLVAEARIIAPDLAGAEVLRDPDQLAGARQLVLEARARRAPLSAPLPDLTLARLGVGPSNRVALEAIAGVLAEPGVRSNPLVLVGPSGVGKTHLLHALGNALVARGVGPVACLSAHSLLGELANIKSAEEVGQWRARYQWVAALLIDDVHLVAHETRCQAELLNVYEALFDGTRPLAFTSARPLSELNGFDPRLLTRLEGGTVVDVGPPDREVRLAIVKASLADTPAAGDIGLLDYLAGRPADSVRSVHGVVQRVLAEAQAERAVPSTAFAREILEVVETKSSQRDRGPMAPSSGIQSPGMGIVRSSEKMILTWPTAADRLLTEFH